MRIYDGGARQDFEEVFRAIGAVLDERAYREILVTEVPDGFLVQGLRTDGANASNWADTSVMFGKETLTFSDDEIARYMEEAIARRGKNRLQTETPGAHYYEWALRVIGRYLDEQHPRDVFFFEQDGSFVVRLLMSGQGGSRHVLVEFTRDDVLEMIGQGPGLRGRSSRLSMLLGR